MKKYRLGIVGIGGIARFSHIPALLAGDYAEIVAVCDINPKKMDFELLPKGVKKFTDYREMLQCGDIDCVHVCTPNYLHSEITVAALKAGKHVFCEKPDAVSVEEALKMMRAEKESGKHLMVMRNNRFVEGSAYLKKQIESGNFGEIYAGRCGWIRRRGIPGKGGWFTTKAQSGGGPLIDLGVHMIDLAVYLMGNPKPVAVSGSTYCKFANSGSSDSVHSAFGEKVIGGTFDVEDMATGYIRFDNGASLQIEFSWASNVEAERNFVELRGSKAGFTWDGGKVKIFGEKNGLLTDETLHCAYEDGHKRCIEHFYRVLNGEKPVYTIEQGIDMIKILSAIYESAETGKEVRL